MTKLTSIRNDIRQHSHADEHAFVANLVTNNPLSYVYISHELRYHKEIAVSAVQKYGHLLQFATDLSDNSGVVVPALQQNGMALQFASPTLQNTKDVVLKAIKQNGMALQYAGPNVSCDISGVVLYAIKQYCGIINSSKNSVDNNDDDY